MTQSHVGTALSGASIGQAYIFRHPTCYAYITQGTWGDIYNANYPHYALVYNSSNTQNDRIDYAFWLTRGTYSLNALGTTLAAGGISYIYLDDTYIEEYQDWYSAGTVWGVIKTTTGITVAKSGRHIISFKVAQQHPSSSGYYLYIHSLAMWRAS